MMVMMNFMENEPEQLELFVEEEEPLPTWGEIVPVSYTHLTLPTPPYV